MPWRSSEIEVEGLCGDARTKLASIGRRCSGSSSEAQRVEMTLFAEMKMLEDTDELQSERCNNRPSCSN